MTKRPELATEVMRTDAGLHADQARRHIGEPCFNLATRPLLTQHDCTAAIEAEHVELVIGDIYTYYGHWLSIPLPDFEFSIDRPATDTRAARKVVSSTYFWTAVRTSPHLRMSDLR